MLQQIQPALLHGLQKCLQNSDDGLACPQLLHSPLHICDGHGGSGQAATGHLFSLSGFGCDFQK
jgi:hypothetical protein